MGSINHKSLLSRIAREAGVSVMTVSRVMSGRVAKYRPAQERARRVLAIAQRLNYRPSAAARAMATGRFRAVSLMLPGGRGFHTVLFRGMLDGIHDRLADEDYHLIVTRVAEALDSTKANELPKVLRENVSDGFLINYAHELPTAIFRHIRRLQIPLVWINFGYARDCVALDDARSARLAVERLIAAGHRRIAYVHHRPSPHYSAAERAAGYEAAMRAAGLPCETRQEREVLPEGQVQQAYLAWLRSPSRPTAIVCYSRETTLLVLTAAVESHLEVPRDLTIVQFGEWDAFQLGQRIFTVGLPWYELGAAAAEMLLAKLQHPRRRFARRRLPLVLKDLEQLPAL